MSFKFDILETGAFDAGVRGFLAIVCVALLSACSYHPPSPVEEHSTAIVKRQLNSDGSYYVRSGDTLYAIAFAYGMDPREVAKWNGISSPYVIYPGQKLRLLALPASSRGTSGVKISTIKTPAHVTTKTVSSPKPSTQTKSPPASGTSSTTKTASPVNAQASNTADPESWKWPTRGRVVRSYVAGDPARNGLDIAGKEGQTIVASSGGQVVYSGNGLIGYGELIIIKHSEKMLSAYAHNKIRLVKEGEQVSAGQKIAEMGRNSGNKQLLHFEIRAQGKPVDPLTYLPKQ